MSDEFELPSQKELPIAVSIPPRTLGSALTTNPSDFMQASFRDDLRDSKYRDVPEAEESFSQNAFSFSPDSFSPVYTGRSTEVILDADSKILGDEMSRLVDVLSGRFRSNIGLPLPCIQPDVGVHSFNGGQAISVALHTQDASFSHAFIFPQMQFACIDLLTYNGQEFDLCFESNGKVMTLEEKLAGLGYATKKYHAGMIPYGVKRSLYITDPKAQFLHLYQDMCRVQGSTLDQRARDILSRFLYTKPADAKLTLNYFRTRCIPNSETKGRGSGSFVDGDFTFPFLRNDFSGYRHKFSADDLRADSKILYPLSVKGSDFAIGITSRVQVGKEQLHIPMIDFVSSDAFAVGRAMKTVGETGFLVKSGSSFHFYGDRLLSLEEHRTFHAHIQSLDPEVFDTTFAKMARYRGFSNLRITPGAPYKLHQPVYLMEINR